MNILINGEPQTFDSQQTVAQMIQERLGENARGIAVAINDSVVPKSAWSSTPINDGDRIEIVRATQGG